MRTTKRLCSLFIVFCFVFSMMPSLMPVKVFAAGTTRTASLDLRDLHDMTGDTSEGWMWDSMSKTLTLSGLNLELDEVVGGKGLESNPSAVASAIILPMGSTVEVLEGTTNTITVTSNSGDYFYGIYSEGDLTLRGKGTLQVRTPNSQESDPTYACYPAAITGRGLVTIDGPTINAAGGYIVFTGDASNGMPSSKTAGISGNDIEIKSGKITAISGSESSNETRLDAYGIVSNGTLKISGGSLCSQGQKAAVSANGALDISDDMTVLGSTDWNTDDLKEAYLEQNSVIGSRIREDNSIAQTVVISTPIKKIHIYSQGGDYTGDNILKTDRNGMLATLPVPVREGYTFEGWYDETEGGNRITTDTVFTDDSEIYAQWSANTYDVTLNTNGGTINSGKVERYTYQEIEVVLPTDVTREGYIFGGWYDNAGCTGTAVSSITFTDIGNKTFYAKWTKAEDGTDGSLIAEVQVRDGAPATTVDGIDTDVAKGLLNEEELERVTQGENLLVYLEVSRLDERAVPSVDKAKTEEAVRSIDNIVQGMYLDLSIWKKVGTEDAERLDSVQTRKPLTISISIPDELGAPEGRERTYYIVRVHDGVAAILDTQLTGDIISFETDQFSTYSILYTEKEVSDASGSVENTDNTENTKKDNANTTADTKKDSTGTVKTGDNSRLGIQITLLLLSVMVLIAVNIKRYKK